MTLLISIPKRPLRESVRAATIAEQLGWPLAIVLKWAAFDAGIRASDGWTPAQIEQLCFLRATAERWR